MGLMRDLRESRAGLGTRIGLTLAWTLGLMGVGMLPACAMAFLTTQRSPWGGGRSDPLVEPVPLCLGLGLAGVGWLVAMWRVWRHEPRRGYLLWGLGGTVLGLAGMFWPLVLGERARTDSTVATIMGLLGCGAGLILIPLVWRWVVGKLVGPVVHHIVVCPSCGADMDKCTSTKCPTCKVDLSLKVLASSVKSIAEDPVPLWGDNLDEFQASPSESPLVYRTARQRRALRTALVWSAVLGIAVAALRGQVMRQLTGDGDSVISAAVLIAAGVGVWVWTRALNLWCRRMPMFDSDGLLQIFCPACGYHMLGLREPRCPEYGRLYSLGELIEAQRYARMVDGPAVRG